MPINTENTKENFTAKDAAKFVAKTAAISFTISAATQPLQAVLTRVQVGNNQTAIPNKFGLLPCYRGFYTIALAGQRRGFIGQASKEMAREEQTESKQKALGLLAFSQADILVSSACYNRGILINAGTIDKNFPKSFANFCKLTKVNWGSRSISGLANFALIGPIGENISSQFNFENELTNHLVGGATSGVIATVFTTPFNLYADRKVLASKAAGDALKTLAFFSTVKNVKNCILQNGFNKVLGDFLSKYLLELGIRTPMSAVTFSIIFGMTYAFDIYNAKQNSEDPTGEMKEIREDLPSPNKP